MEFRKFNGQKVDLVPYVSGYCQEHKNIDILIGTDSQCNGNKTYFSTIVALYDKGDGEHGHGAHCITRKWHTKRYKKYEIYNRMMAETDASLEVAKILNGSGISIAYVDIDINPNEGAGSNIAFTAAKGKIESEGFECRWKTLAPLCTTAADYVVRT